MFIAAAVVLNYFVGPTYQKIKSLRLDLAKQSSILAEYQKAADIIKDLSSRYGDADRDTDGLSETISFIVPPQENLPSAVNQIVGLASFNSLEIRSLLVEKTAITASAGPGVMSGLGKIRFSFDTSGSYTNFKKFLENLETNLNIMDLENLTLATRASKSSEIFNYTVVVSTYYQAK